ncbi:MAG: amino acid ABC transporter permease [Anaerolineae bacterium SM23_ 63]|nr:MAG: amino acid ABC transporter permease [Anaerolineae bacterium SM23_ 63]HEY48385.1 amino acid ABC transporter permease [Anaerolineae bacterium]
MAVQPEVLKPPLTEVGLLGWLKKNLFSTWYNALLTIFSGIFIYGVLRAVITWVVRDARWTVITTNFRVFMIGRYPPEEAWRVLVSLGIVVLLVILTWMSRKTKDNPMQRWLVISWLISIPLIGILLRGFSGERSFLPLVSEDIWSGLLLTLVLAIVGIVASFPLGVLLALGRRSKLPIIKVLSTAYIETIRGVPLISVLFMSQLMLPLFLPPEIRLGTVMRALTGMTLFSAAYTAENVRGGLAAIPRGQYEAARAVGLNEALVMVLIVLPQALRAVIPAIVGQFISLFKDTTLVVIVGLLDVLGIAKAVTGQREFIGLHKEVYAFAAVLFFICCFTMSTASRRLEQTLGVGER